MTDSFGVRDDQTRKDLNKPEKKEIGTDLPKPIADYGEEELIEWLKDKAPQIFPDFYRRGYPTFEVTGGAKVPYHDKSEYQMATESKQGILFTNTGNCKLLGNASVEVISNGKKNGNEPFDGDSDAGIVLYAKKGVIHIEAVAGDITIRTASSKHDINIESARNINMVAKENFNINVGSNYKCTTVGNHRTITEEKTLMHSGEELSLHCDTDNIQTSSGFDEELAGKELRELIINDHDDIDKITEG
tara:strand:- start:395 stop:1132 length:738 start_codon:yes stop_codon:yes gene_type:complete